MKISFIVPVYNVSKYLHQCVRSILVQSYKDIEVVLVDDGSEDESPIICDAFAKEDKRVIVIHKQNGGLSDARNVGLQSATGEYVVFIDGDDFWRDDSQLEALVKVATNYPECDFIGFNCCYFYPETDTYTPWVEYSEKLARPTDKNTAMTELVKSGTFPMSACLKLMKREFLLRNELFFVKGQIAEDIPWFINMLDRTRKCCFVSQYVYAYRQNVTGSITSSSGDKSFRSLLNIVETEAPMVATRSFSEEAKNALNSFLAYELSILLTYENMDKEAYKKLLSYGWLLNYDTNPKVKIVKKVKKLLGMSLTVKLLKMYNKKRKSKK